MPDEVKAPKVPVKSARKSLLERVSVVWIVPLLALAIVFGVAWQSYVDRGPVIRITFDSAAGVRAGETELRYRDVTVGLVESVGFTGGLSHVLVTVRLNKDVADYVDGDAQFWIVRPKVTTQGVSGLDTVLTGVFIEGLWNDTPDGLQEDFTGLPDAPLDRLGRDGLYLTLRAAGETMLTENTPILYRGIEVGRVGKTRISDDGSTAEAEALIFKPHDSLITSATRFWDASGFSFSVGPGGASIDFKSIASLVSGGVTFETVVSGGKPVDQNAVFSVYPDEAGARSSVFAGEEGEALNLTAIFEDNVAGLTSDALVMLNGLTIGKVTALNGIVDPARFGDDRVRLAATLSIQPGRLGLEGGGGPEEALAFLNDRVKEGLRARLVSASILTGGLNVELVEVPGVAEAGIDMTGGPNPVIPTTDSKISDVSATAEGVFQRINALPIEQVLNNAIDLMASANALISGDDARAMPGNINGLVTDARGLLASDDIRALSGNLNKTLDELRAILTQIREGGAIENANSALSSASGAAEKFAKATEGLPAVIQKAQDVLAQASETLKGYQANAGIARDTRAAIREVERAAQAVSSLARALERKPNSLLMGR